MGETIKNSCLFVCFRLAVQCFLFVLVKRFFSTPPLKKNRALRTRFRLNLIDIDPKLLFKPIFSPPQAKIFDILHVKIFQEKLENSRKYFRYGRKKSFQTKKNDSHSFRIIITNRNSLSNQTEVLVWKSFEYPHGDNHELEAHVNNTDRNYNSVVIAFQISAPV